MALAVSSTSAVKPNNPIYLHANTAVNEQHTALQQQITFLQQQNKQYQQWFDLMPTAMVVLDGNGIVSKINQAATLMLDEPILGQPWVEVISRSFAPQEDDWHEVSLKDGRKVKLDIQPLADEPGQLIIITDLTETRRLQDKLNHMQKLSALGRMVSSLAHQIRTPLSSAMLYGANLASDKLSNESKQQFQQKLMARLHDLEHQVNDMLLFAKSGQQQVVTEVDVNQLVLASVHEMQELANKKQASLQVKLDQSAPFILGNESALKGALHNLIDNSLSVIDERAQVKLSVSTQGTWVIIDVQDNGPGIAKDKHDKIFEPFFTSRAQGTGLGLAVVKSVLTAHQGKVELCSSTPSHGAHFKLYIPRLMVDQEASHG